MSDKSVDIPVIFSTDVMEFVDDVEKVRSEIDQIKNRLVELQQTSAGSMASFEELALSLGKELENVENSAKKVSIAIKELNAEQIQPNINMRVTEQGQQIRVKEVLSESDYKRIRLEVERLVAEGMKLPNIMQRFKEVSRGVVGEMETVRRVISDMTAEQKQADAARIRAAKEQANKVAQLAALQREVDAAQAQAEKKRLADARQAAKEQADKVAQLAALQREADAAQAQAEKKRLADARQAAKEREANIRQLVLLQREATKGLGADVNLNTATKSVKNFTKEVAEMKRVVSQTAVTTKQSFSQVAASMRDNMQLSASQSRALTQATKELNEEQKKSTWAFNAVRVSLAAFVGTFTVGGIYAVVNSLVNFFTQASQKAIEASRALNMFQISVRGLQRAGVEISMDGAVKQVDELARKYTMFSKTSIREVMTQVMLMGRSFELTQEQMLDMANAAIVLSIATGKDAKDAVGDLTMAMASGYNEAIENAGISMSKLQVEQKGVELGFGKNYQQMTNNQRAAAALALVMEQLAPIEEDIMRLSEDATGRLAAAESRYAELTQTLGNEYTPAVVLAKDVWNEFIVVLTQVSQVVLPLALKAFQGFATSAMTILGSVTAAALNLYDVMSGKVGNLRNPLDWGGKIGIATFNKIQEYIDLTKRLDLGDTTIIPPYNTGGGTGTDNLEAMASLKKDLLEEILRLNQQIIDAEIDFNRKMFDIGEKFKQQVVDATTDFRRKLREIDIEYRNKALEAQEDYNDKEIEAQNKLLEELRKLRDKFLFNLEDAVRERDAKQAYRLIRQYQFDKDQLIKANDADAKEREEDYKRKLADLEKAKRLEREKEQRAYKDKLDDLILNLKRQQEEERLSYKRQLHDLNRASQDRINIVAARLAQELALTKEGMRLVYEEMAKYYGKGGLVEGLYKYVIRLMNTGFGGLGIPNSPTTTSGTGGSLPSVPSLPSLPSTSSSFPNGNSMNKTTVVIELEAGLKGEIVDAALDKMAEVILKQTNKKVKK